MGKKKTSVGKVILVIFITIVAIITFAALMGYYLEKDGKIGDVEYWLESKTDLVNGSRVEYQVDTDTISKKDLETLISKHYKEGLPDGQIVISGTSVLDGEPAPFAVYNFGSSEFRTENIIYNDFHFNEP